MNIIVFTKIVPANQNTKIDKASSNMIRDSENSKINPSDLVALQNACKLKYYYENCFIECVSMSSIDNEIFFRSLLALGADKVTILTDRKFKGSDALGTSLILNEYIKQNHNWSIILMGESSIDGNTGQLPYRIAALQDIPIITDIVSINDNKNGEIIITQRYKGIEKKLAISGKAILVTKDGSKTYKYPKLSEIKDATSSSSISYIDQITLKIVDSMIGEINSKTKVINNYANSCNKDCSFINSVKEFDELLKSII